jgi:hypothetical protein
MWIWSEVRSRRGLEKYKGKVAPHLLDYDFIDLFVVLLEPRFSLGFWQNPSILGLVSVVQYPP